MYRPAASQHQSNAAGTLTDYYIWIDRGGNLRYHTSMPTDEDANGTIIAGSSTAGASKALDNLASVAVAEMWKRYRQKEFDKSIEKKGRANAMAYLTQSPMRKKYG